MIWLLRELASIPGAALAFLLSPRFRCWLLTFHHPRTETQVMGIYKCLRCSTEIFDPPESPNS